MQNLYDVESFLQKLRDRKYIPGHETCSSSCCHHLQSGSLDELLAIIVDGESMYVGPYLIFKMLSTSRHPPLMDQSSQKDDPSRPKVTPLRLDVLFQKSRLAHLGIHQTNPRTTLASKLRLTSHLEALTHHQCFEPLSGSHNRS